MKLTVKELAEKIGAELTDDSSAFISGVAAIQAAGEEDVVFVTSDKYAALLTESSAAAVLTPFKLEAAAMPQLLVKDIDAALVCALKIFAPRLRALTPGIHRTALISPDACIDQTACIGPFATVSPGAAVAAGAVIGQGCSIGENTKIGERTRLDANVAVYHNCRIGNDVIIQAGSVIGSTGFGYAFIDGAHRLIPHNGGVIIEDFVEIGANCCIDRAKFANTVIGAGTKVDNLVQIAHNVVIGKCCLIAGQVGIAGSARLGNGVVLAGHAGIGDNVELGDGVTVGAKSVVIKDFKKGTKIFGMPAREYGSYMRVQAALQRMPRELSNIKARIDNLEASKDDKN